jgi:hypothetical protein
MQAVEHGQSNERRPDQHDVVPQSQSHHERKEIKTVQAVEHGQSNERGPLTAIKWKRALNSTVLFLEGTHKRRKALPVQYSSSEGTHRVGR